jgi:hypothetical protein
MLDHRLAMPTTYMLHGFQEGATYEEILKALENLFEDQPSQLRTRTHGVLQKFSGTVEQLAHSAYPAVPEEEGRQGVHRHGRRPHHKNSASAAERKPPGKRDCQESPRVAGRAPISQAPKNDSQHILGKPIAPNREKKPKPIGILLLWRARPLPGFLPLQEGWAIVGR